MTTVHPSLSPPPPQLPTTKITNAFLVNFSKYVRIEKARGRQFPDAMSLEDSMKAPLRSVPIKPVPLSLLLGGLHRSVCCVFVHYVQQGTEYKQQGVMLAGSRAPFPRTMVTRCQAFVFGSPGSGRKYLVLPGMAGSTLALPGVTGSVGTSSLLTIVSVFRFPAVGRPEVRSLQQST